MPAYTRSTFLFLRSGLPVLLCALALLAVIGCGAELRKSDAELGLNSTQAFGRRVFDANCARCHEPYSKSGLHGPSLHSLYKKQFMPSGQPANDERITETVLRGRAKMPAFSGTITQRQLDALLEYLKTL